MAPLPKPLKIGLVLDTSLDPPDGVQQYIISIGEWFRAEGHDVHYVVGQTARNDLENIHSLSRNVTVRSNGNQTTIPLPTSRSKLRRFLEEQQFDVLHVQMPYSPFMSQRLIRAADSRVAVIGTFHIVAYSWLESFGTKLLGYWSRLSLGRFDKIVSVSTAARDFAKKTFGISTTVLPNVIDFPRFHTAKPLPEYHDDVLTILFLGRLVPRKGCQLLLEAITLIAQDEKLPSFRVVVCGKGQLDAQLKRYVVAHGLEEIVEFVGFVSETDKPRYYASADISVFPSTGGESFGIVLLEAMASGKATVLAGDNPGYRSVMAPQSDLLFDTHEVAELANKLRLHLNDVKLREQLSKWGASYTKDFDVSIVGNTLLDIYRKALRKRRDP